MTSLTIDMTEYVEYEEYEIIKAKRIVSKPVTPCDKEKKAIAMTAGAVLAAAPISIMIASPVLAIFGLVGLMAAGHAIKDIK